MITKGGDNMKGEGMKYREGQEEGYDYTSECIDKLDQMIENPKMATPEALMEIRDKLANEGEEPEMDDGEDMREEGKPSLMIMIGKGLKKGMKLLILGGFIVLGYTNYCTAENLTRKDWDNTRYDLYRSTVVDTVGTFVISTYPVIIDSVDVGTATTSSSLTIYDSTASAIISARRKTLLIGGSSQCSYIENLQHNRGLTAVVASPAATYNIKYKEK